MEYLHKDITEKIISAFYKVYNTLGFGFLEKVYKKALYIELNNLNIYCQTEKPVKVYYDGIIIGDYFADIIVEDKVIIEIKAVEKLVHENELQLINYLKTTNIEIGLLLNFGIEPEIKRKIYTNDMKKL